MTLSEHALFIIGPQVATGDYFDATLLAQAKKFGEWFPATPPPADQMDNYTLTNYYDLGRTEYVAYKLTNDPVFLGYARNVTDSWYQCPYIKGGTMRQFDGPEATSPKFVGMVGLILRALDGRPEMWDWINAQTRYYLDLWLKTRINDPELYLGTREGAFSLQFAAILAKVLPDSFPLQSGGTATNGAQLRAEYLADVEAIAVRYFGRLQYPDGSWRWDDPYYVDSDGGTLKAITQPFMIGMLTRALIDVHRLTTNPTVKESAKSQICNACRYLYSGGPFTRTVATTFNVPLGGFHYFINGGTTVNPTKYVNGDFPFDTTERWHVESARQLMATCIGSFPYAAKISGDEFFKRAGEEMYRFAYSGVDGFRAMMADTAKNFNQHVFGTSNYKGWLSGAIVEPEPEPLPPPPPPPPPLEESPDGTKGPRIVDSERAEWTIGSNSQTLRNGAHAGGGAGSIYKYLGKAVYTWGDVEIPETEQRNWYMWANSAWVKIGTREPGVVVTPPPPPTCTISAPASVSIPRNNSGTITVTVNDLTGPTEVKVLNPDGQVAVTPLSWTAQPTSASKQFTVRTKNKKQVRTITFQSPCGVAAVKVNVT